MTARAPLTLVTGAAGFAGLHLVDRLGRSAVVHGWTLPGTPRPPTTVPVTWHDVDITDGAAVDRAIQALQPDRIFHLAGAPSVETSWTNAVPHLAVNAMGAAHLVDAVRRHAPRCRVLVVTSAQVYRNGEAPIDEAAPLGPPSPYGLTKLAQDQLAEAAARVDGMDVVVARPFNHIGPGQAPGFAVPSFARQIARIERGLDPPVIRVGNLDTCRDFTDVRDVAAAYCHIMDGAPAGRVYNVCSGSAYRIGDLLDTLVGLAQVVIRVSTDPDRLRPADIPRILGDNSRLRTELGWAPRIPITTTLKDTLEWWRQQTRQAAT